jgi:hypothetical protein
MYETKAIVQMTKHYDNALERAGQSKPIDDELFDIWNAKNIPLGLGARFAVVEKGIELLDKLSKSAKLGDNAKEDAKDLANDLRKTREMLERSNTIEILAIIAKEAGKDLWRERFDALERIQVILYEDNGAHATKELLDAVFPLLKNEHPELQDCAADIVAVAIALKPELYEVFMGMSGQKRLHADVISRCCGIAPHKEIMEKKVDAATCDRKLRTAQAVNIITDQVGGKALVAKDQTGKFNILPIPQRNGKG